MVGTVDAGPEIEPFVLNRGDQPFGRETHPCFGRFLATPEYVDSLDGGVLAVDTLDSCYPGCRWYEPACPPVSEDAPPLKPGCYNLGGLLEEEPPEFVVGDECGQTFGGGMTGTLQQFTVDGRFVPQKNPPVGPDGPFRLGWVPPPGPSDPTRFITCLPEGDWVADCLR